MFWNFDHSFELKGKHIFVQPNDASRRAKALLERLISKVAFPDYFYHYQPGGHIAAIHSHLKNRIFIKVDITNFYYSISRNRVAAALHSVGFKKARSFAKWSCVRSPYGNPRYAIPIGFVQSPFLASLVLSKSPVRSAMESFRDRGLTVSVYFDDFIVSGNDEHTMKKALSDLRDACIQGNFVVSERKTTTAPVDSLVAFNCNIRSGHAEVSPERWIEFLATSPTAASVAGFEKYALRVCEKNTPPPP